MDNLTHSLFGVLIAHALCPPGPLRKAAVWTAVLSSNLPDLDLVLRPFFEDGKLAYLVHHRGYTHTLLAALPQALCSAMLGAWWGGLAPWWKLLAPSPPSQLNSRAGDAPDAVPHLPPDEVGNSPGDAETPRPDPLTATPAATASPRRHSAEPVTAGLADETPAGVRLLIIALVGLALHIGADSWNNYGVHPFWPLFNQWLYGDFIFIIEPLLLMVLLTWVLFHSHTRALKGLLGALMGGVLLLVWALPMLPWGVGLGVSVWGGANLFVQRRWPGLGAPFSGLLVVLAAFLTGSIVARSQVTLFLALNTPGEQVLEVALTPQAANPLCWQTIVLSRGGPANSRYLARVGNVSLAPALFPPDRCDVRPSQARSVILETARLPVDPHFSWEGSFTGDSGQLKSRAARDCRVSAFMRFARAPFWLASEPGVFIGDLRYDMEPEAGFAELELEVKHEWKHCEGYLPPWHSRVTDQLGF